jgi:uncharacterized membrane protein YhaH (DUF805 family)
MPLAQLLFSFRGRINRAPYWLATIGVVLVYSVVVVALVAGMWGVGRAEGGGIGLLVLLGVIFGVVVILLLWNMLALAAKRLHDLNKSAWWIVPYYVLPSILQLPASLSTVLPATNLLLDLISVAISAWVLVELGFLPGTVGPNRFGPDPLQAPELAAAIG